MERETIQQKIKKIAMRFKNCNYHYMSWVQLNECVGREDLELPIEDIEEVVSSKPVICYLLPPSGYFNIKQNGDTMTDNPLTAIVFIEQSEMDADGEANDIIIERMKHLAQCFIREMNKSGDFNFIDKEQIVYSVVNERSLDDAFAGICVTIPLEGKPFYLCGETTDFGFE